LLASAAAFRALKRATEFGLSTNGIGFDFSKIIDRKDWIVSQITGPRMRKFFEDQGIAVIEGTARFRSKHEIEVSGRAITFEKAVIATGSTPFVPPIEGIDKAGYITSNEAINLRDLPDSIIIIGASGVGLEFGAIFESFGAKVTIIENAPTIAPKEDIDISLALSRYMNGRGIDIHTGARITEAMRENGVKSVVFESEDGEKTVTAQEILVATGRRPLLDGLNLEEIGIETSKKGVIVNAYLQTTVDNIFAAGDIVPGFQLAQAAAYEGDLAGLNAFSEKKTEANYRVMPRVTWSYPELSSVGITENDAKEQGLDYVTQKFMFGGLARAFADGEQLGFIKAIADADGNELIGLHAIGHHADELIHEAVIAMHSRVKVSELAEAIHCELTMAEGIGNVFIDLHETIEQRKKMAA